MALPIGDPAAYELISARDGGDVPAAYGVTRGPAPAAEVTAGAAISADGRRSCFAPGDRRPSGRARSPPRGPDLRARPRGQRDHPGDAERRTTARRPAGPDGVGPAAISADGTTVVWTGTNAAAQTAFFPGEDDQPRSTTCGAGSPTARRRRRAGSPASSTPTIPAVRRVRPCDPDDHDHGALLRAADASGGQSSAGGIIASQLPALSADGRQVAFLTGPGAAARSDQRARQLDLFVTDMSAGRDSQGGHVRADARERGSRTARSSRLAISADGRRIAFVTDAHGLRAPDPAADDAAARARRSSGRAVRASISARWRSSGSLRGFDGGTSTKRSWAMSERSRCPTMAAGSPSSRARRTSSSATATQRRRLRRLGGGPERRRAASPRASRRSQRSAHPARAGARSAQSLRLKVRAQGQLAARHGARSRARPGRGPGAGPCRPRGKKMTTLASGRTRATQGGIEDLHRAAREALSRRAAPPGRDPHAPGGHLHAYRRRSADHSTPDRLAARLSTAQAAITP